MAAVLARVTAAVRSRRLLRPPAAHTTAPKRRVTCTRWRADQRLNQPLIRPRRTGNRMRGVPAGRLCQSRISEAENQSIGLSAGMQTMTVRALLLLVDTAGCSLRKGLADKWRRTSAVAENETAVDNARGEHQPTREGWAEGVRAGARAGLGGDERCRK